MTGPADSAAHGRDWMCSLLAAGARLDGTHSVAAAVHLLTFTGLPGHRDFARYVRIESVSADGTWRAKAAWVRNWDALLSDGSIYVSGGLRRLLEVAASYAAGRPVDLRHASSGLGTAHAGRLIEAAVIATGMAEYYTVTGTAKLAGLADMRRRWNAPDGAAGQQRQDPRGQVPR